MPDDELKPADEELTSAGAAPNSADAEPVVATAEPPVADAGLLDSVDLARAALLDVTPAETVGPVVGHIVEGEHVLTLLFDAALPGYPGWRWSVTISRVHGEAEPVVLETELMPGEASLLAPDWVPWSERLAEYQASQEVLAAEAASDEDEDEDDDEGDESDDDADDLDEDDDVDDDVDDDEDEDGDVLPVLHSGDIDGVDIDFDDPELDDDADIDTTLDLEAEESAALDADVDESDDAEADADDDGPEPPAVSGGGERNGEDQD